MPRIPPASESNTLSVSNWRTMRARPAPSAERIANSRLRTVARTSSRLATLAQEISSTSPTAPSIISSELRASPMMLSRNGPTRKMRSPIRVRELTVVLWARRHAMGVGLRHSDARLEQSGHLKEEVHVVADRVKLKRQPEVGLRVGDEILSDHADDGVWLIAQRERFPHDGRVAAEPALP